MIHEAISSSVCAQNRWSAGFICFCSLHASYSWQQGQSSCCEHFWMVSLVLCLPISGLWTCVVTQRVHIAGCTGQQNVEPKPLAYLRHMDGMVTTSESMCVFMSRCSGERSADLWDDSSVLVVQSVWSGDSDSISCEARLYTDFSYLKLRLQGLGIPTTARCRKHELGSCHMNDISIRRRVLVTLWLVLLFYLGSRWYRK